MIRPRFVHLIATATFSVCGCASRAPPAAPAPVIVNDTAIAPPQLASCGGGDFDIYFSEWEDELNPYAKNVLTQVQKSMAGCSIQHVRVVGLADATGDEKANLAISRRRAQAIAVALVAGGWPASVIELLAVGEKGATVDGVNAPMRRRASISVTASMLGRAAASR